MGIWAMIIGWLILAALFNAGNDGGNDPFDNN